MRELAAAVPRAVGRDPRGHHRRRADQLRAVRALLIEGPWNRGRAIVIGDAAHACPPTLALGAAMALEDSAVLAEVLLAARRADQDVFDEFVQRRMPRAKAVVEGSMQLASWLLEGKRDADVPGLMGRVMGLISQPA